MLLITLGIVTIILLNDKKEVVLDNVSLKEEIKNNNNFALMVEKNDGTYEESTDAEWPNEGYKLNETLSGCVDSNGNTLENALTYTDGTIKLKTRTNAMCYLYFDIETTLYELCKDYENIDECSQTEDLENVKGIWNSTLEDDGYRYVGTNPDNYICFGYSDASTDCDFTNATNTDLYAYRIIGIFEGIDGTQHLKLIKKETLNTAYMWNEDYETDIDWNDSDLYKGLNGISGGVYSNLFVGNETYSYMSTNSDWYNKIETWDYTATNTKAHENYLENGIYGPHYRYQSVQSTYLHELNRSSKSNQICYFNNMDGTNFQIADCSAGEWETVTTKIGLMYVSDYALSLGSSVLGYIAYDNSLTLKTGWMHIINNDSEYLAAEWTLSYYGRGTSYLFAFSIAKGGAISYGRYDLERDVRPVFYLTSDVTISGEGTIDNPYIVNN